MTIDEAIKNLEYGTKQLEMEIKSGLWIKGSESELRCKEGITLNKQYIEWLKELKDLREENKVLIQKCDRLIKEKGADVQPMKHGRWIKHRIDDPKSILYGAVKDTTCSVCGKSTPYNTEYCMHCGARMDGDSE